MSNYRKIFQRTWTKSHCLADRLTVILYISVNTKPQREWIYLYTYIKRIMFIWWIIHTHLSPSFPFRCWTSCKVLMREIKQQKWAILLWFILLSWFSIFGNLKSNYNNSQREWDFGANLSFICKNKLFGITVTVKKRFKGFLEDEKYLSDKKI